MVDDSNLKKFGLFTLQTVLTLGILPAYKMYSFMQEAQEETKTIIPEISERTVVKKVKVKEEAWRDVPCSTDELLPIARKMAKKHVKEELAMYLEAVQQALI